MEEKTQLPKEVLSQIENDSIERFPVTLTHGNHVRPILIQRAAYVTGATAYATDRYQLQQENAELRRWKMEAAGLLTKIHSYAHKHLEIKLGQCTVEFVIGRAKERDEMKEENAKLKEQSEGWRPLFEDILRDNRNGYIDIDEALCSRIKTFLYGE